MIAFLLLNGGAALAAILTAVATHGVSGGAQALFAALCAYLILVHSVVLLAGLGGQLSAGGAAILVAVALAASAWAARRASRAGESSAPASRPPAVTGATPATVYGALAALAAGVAWLWPHVAHGTRLWIWDDYTYHMIYPTLWLGDRAIAAPTPARSFTMQAWYPLSASLVSAWFMLPFPRARGEALAWVSLTAPLYAGIYVAGAAVLMHRLGAGCAAWAGAVVLFFTSHRIAAMASTFSDADLALATALFAAFVFAVPREAEPARGDAGSAAGCVEAWYAGALSGIALGIKVSAAAPAMVVLAMSLLRARAEASGAPLAGAMRVAVAFGVSWTLTGGYWYLRNLIAAGNPVYPAAFLIWPGAVFPETSLAEYARRYGVGRAIWDAVAVYLHWPRLFGAMAVAGLAGVAGWAAWRRRHLTRPQKYFAGGALTMVAAILVLLPGTPYSAGNPMTFRLGFVHWDSMRYVALVVLLGWVALAWIVDAGGRSARAIGGPLVVSAALLAGWQPRLRTPVAVVGLAVAAVIAAAVADRVTRGRRPAGPNSPRDHRATRIEPLRLALARRRRDLGRRVPIGGAVVTGLCAIAVVAGIVLWRHDAKTAATSRTIHDERFFGGAARALDALPPRTRVAVFGDQSVFLVAGGRLDLEPVRLDRNGRVPAAPVGDAMEPGELTVPPESFVDNLAASGVRVVVVVRLPHPGRPGERPSQERALAAAAGARLLYRGEAVTIWEIRDGHRASPG